MDIITVVQQSGIAGEPVIGYVEMNNKNPIFLQQVVVKLVSVATSPSVTSVDNAAFHYLSESSTEVYFFDDTYGRTDIQQICCFQVTSFS
ncbi:hypothetical protein QTN25_002262 [Entamoeba marina]